MDTDARRPPARRIRHLVWDWNGTLLDDFHLVVAAASDACVPAGRAPITADEYRRCFTRPIERSYELLLGRPLADGEWTTLSRRFHGSYQAQAATARLAAGAVAALTRAAQAGWTQSLLSMWTHQELVPLVDAFSLTGWFQRIDGQRQFGGGPKADHLSAHLQQLGVEGPDVLMVGDSLDDLAAAQSVNAQCILVSGGPHTAEMLGDCGVPVVPSLAHALDLAGIDDPSR
ncbi:MAG: HAD family hydrolase [Acidimicrobiales bacterium]